MNRNGEKPESLKNDSEPVAPEFVTAVGDDAINRFDEARKRKKKKKSRTGNGGQKKAQPAQAEVAVEQKPSEPKVGDKKPSENTGEKKNNGHKGHKSGNRNGGNRRNDRPKKDKPQQGE